MSYTYKCFKVKQRQESEFIFLSFIAKAKDVFEWSHADNIEIDKNGIVIKKMPITFSKISPKH